VKEVMFCAREDKPLERSDLVKGFEYEKGRYLVIEPEELEKITPVTASVMQILQFVRMTEIDPIYFETSYYVSPEEAVSRPYALLLRAMQETEYDAVAKVTMHGREHIVILRPGKQGMVLHTMYFVNELHADKQTKASKPGQLEKKEVDLAKKLIEALAAPFKPESFHDEYRANVEKLIESKRRGKKITPIRQPKTEPVTDLMAALQQSLAGNATRSTRTSKTATRKSTAKRAANVA